MLGENTTILIKTGSVYRERIERRLWEMKRGKLLEYLYADNGKYLAANVGRSWGDMGLKHRHQSPAPMSQKPSSHITRISSASN